MTNGRATKEGQKALAVQLKPITSVDLTRLGFISKRVRSTNIWTLAESQARFDLEIIERRDEFLLTQYHVPLDLLKIKSNLTSSLQKSWGKSVYLDFSFEKNAKTIVTAEWFRAKSPDNIDINNEPSSPTILSWSFRFEVKNDIVSIFIEDFSLIGQDAPKDWYADVAHLTLRSICGKFSNIVSQKSLFEFEINAKVFIFSKVCPKSSPEEVPSITEQIHVAREKKLLLLVDSTCASNLVFQLDDENPQLDEKFTPTQYIAPSMEVLESRNLSSAFKIFDRNIFNKKPLSKIEGSSHGAIFRKALHSLQNLDSAVLDRTSLDSNELDSESTNITELSARFQRLRKTDAPLATEALQDWFNAFKQIHHHQEPNERLISGILETYGDIQKNIEPEQALVAWNTCLNPSNAPRILRKIAQLNQLLDRVEDEFNAQVKSLNYERRRDGKKIIFERLASLYASKDLPVKAAEQIKVLIDGNYGVNNSWVDSCKMIALKGEPEKATDLLYQILKLSKEQKSGAEIEDKILRVSSEIWSDCLERPDLAVPYYLSKIEHVDHPTSVDIIDAEDRLIAFGALSEAMASRLRRWQLMNPQTRAYNISLADSLQSYLSSIRDFKNQSSIFVDLISIDYKPTGFLTFLQENSERIADWRTILNLCQLKKDDLKFSATEAIYLSKMARDKLNDHKVAVSFLLEKSVAQELDDSNFSYLLEKLEPGESRTMIADILIERLDSTSADIRHSALKSIVNGDYLDLIKDIEFLVCKDWLENKDISIILKRVASLLTHKEYKKLDLLLKEIFDSIQQGASGIELTTEILNIFEDYKEVPLSSVTFLTNSMINLSFGNNDYLNKILKSLLNRDLFKDAFNAAKLIIDSGSIPDCNPRDLDKIVLGEPRYQEKVSLLKFKRSEKSEAPMLARESISYMKINENWNDDMETCYRFLIEYNHVILDDLADIRKLCDIKQNYHLLIEAILKISSQNYEHKKELLLEAASLASQKMGSAVRAYEITLLALSESESSTDQLLLAHSAYAAGHFSHVTQIAVSFLRDPKCLEMPEMVLEFCSLLNASDEAKGLVSNVVQTLISWSKTTNDHNAYQLLVSFAIQHSLAPRHLIQHEILNRVTKDDLQLGTNYMVKWFLKFDPQRETISELVDSLVEDFQSSGKLEIWYLLLKELSNESQLLKLPSVVRQEILLRYSQWLNHSNDDQKEALKILIDSHRENPNDARVWIPLYLLLEEMNEDSKLVSLLDRIIPKIELNASIIEKYPINVSTMKLSLKRARARLVSSKSPNEPHTSSKSKKPMSSMPQKTPSSHEKVRAIQDEIIDAIPQIKLTGSYTDGLEKNAPSDDAQQIIESNAEVAYKQNKSFQYNEDPATEVNWRELVQTRSFKPGDIRSLYNQHFESEEERHIALQAVALLSGSVKELDTWMWQPWKETAGFAYSISGKDRSSKDDSYEILRTKKERALSSLSIPLMRKIKDKTSIESFLRAKDPSTRLNMKRISHDKPVLQSTGLKYFTEKMASEKFIFVDTPEIGNDIYVDPIARSIHFSVEDAKLMRPGYLFHRIKYQVDVISKEHFSLLNASIANDYPHVIDFVLNATDETAFARLKSGFNLDLIRIEKLFSNLDLTRIKRQLNMGAPFLPSEVKQLQLEIEISHYRHLLSSSLDLIGIFEAITGLNSELVSKNEIQTLIESNRILKDLIHYTTLLKF